MARQAATWTRRWMLLTSLLVLSLAAFPKTVLASRAGGVSWMFLAKPRFLQPQGGTSPTPTPSTTQVETPPKATPSTSTPVPTPTLASVTGPVNPVDNPSAAPAPAAPAAAPAAPAAAPRRVAYNSSFTAAAPGNSCPNGTLYTESVFTVGPYKGSGNSSNYELTFLSCLSETSQTPRFVGPTSFVLAPPTPAPAPVAPVAPAPSPTALAPAPPGGDDNSAVIIIVVVVVAAALLVGACTFGIIWKRRKEVPGGGYLHGANTTATYKPSPSGASMELNPLKPVDAVATRAAPPMESGPPPMVARAVPTPVQPRFATESNSGFFNPDLNILPTKVFGDANATGNAAADFGRRLLQALKEMGVEGRLAQLRSDTVFRSPRAARFALESVIAGVLFHNFAQEDFGVSGLSLKGDRKARRDRLQLEYNRMEARMTTKGCDSYQARCLDDLSRSLSSGLQVHEAEIQKLLTSNREVHDKFNAVLRSVYQLHAAAFTFEPPVQLIFPARGTRIDANVHEVCNSREADEQGVPFRLVAFAVFPGYRLEGTHMKSVVYGMPG